MKKLVLLASLIAMAACGGGSGTGPVDQSTAEDGCRASCEHRAECNPDQQIDIDQCTTDCVDEVVGVIREDVFVDVMDCEAALACDATDDTCFEDNCEPTSAHQAFEDRCRDELPACGFTGTDLDACEVDPSAGSGGDAGFFCALTPDLMNDLTACFDEATCDDKLSCIEGILDASGV